MESYFVVSFDHETKKFKIDADTMDAHFEANCFDGSEWIYPEGEDLEKDDIAGSLLLSMIEEHNKGV